MNIKVKGKKTKLWSGRQRERVGDVVVSPGTMTSHLVVIISAVFGLLDESSKVGVVIFMPAQEGFTC